MADKLKDTRRTILSRFTQRTLKVKKENKPEDDYYEFRLNKVDKVQHLMEMICQKWYGGKYGAQEIELQYEKNPEIKIKFSHRIDQLESKKLICRILENTPKSSQQTPPVIEVQSEVDGTNQNDLLKHVLIVGRTGSGKSLLGCVLLDMYKEHDGFEVSNDPDSCTKYAACKSSVKNNINVYDTKGFFDTEAEKDYKNGNQDRKLQIVEEIMQVLQSIENTGIHGILLVVKMGRLDDKDKIIIDNLAEYLFKEGMRRKVYLVFTHSLPKYVEDKQLGVKWLNEQCGKKDSKLKKYYDVVEHNFNRVFFVDNKNPDDAKKNGAKECQEDNKGIAKMIIETLHKNGNDKVLLRDIYYELSKEYSELKSEDEKELLKNKLSLFETRVMPEITGGGKKRNPLSFCSLL